MSEKLPNWNAKTDRQQRNAMAIGASNVRGFGLATPDSQCWLSKIRDTYSRWPSRGRGFKMYPLPDFAATGSHTKIDSGLDDRSPYGIQARLSGSGNSFRFTKTAGDVIKAVVYEDATGSGDFSISLDGAAYASAGAATAHDHALKLAQLASQPSSTLDIRGANAGGSTVQCDLLGVLLENTTGLVRWDNVAIDGHRLSGAQASTLDSFARTGSAGDPMAIIELLDPDACFLSDHINDVSVNPSIDAGWLATFETALNAVIDRLQAISCDPIVIIYPETDPAASANLTLANQALLRQKQADVAASQGCETLDVFSLFGGSYTAGISAGFFQADNLHWTASGHDAVAKAAWRLLAQTGGAFLRA